MVIAVMNCNKNVSWFQIKLLTGIFPSFKFIFYLWIGQKYLLASFSKSLHKPLPNRCKFNSQNSNHIIYWLTNELTSIKINLLKRLQAVWIVLKCSDYMCQPFINIRLIKCIFIINIKQKHQDRWNVSLKSHLQWHLKQFIWTTFDVW